MNFALTRVAPERTVTPTVLSAFFLGDLTIGGVMPRLKDLTGQKFGRLTVIRRDVNVKPGRPRWLCSCDCGNEKIVAGGDLRSGHTSSCGCLFKDMLASKRMDLTGDRYGRLTVKSWDMSAEKWACVCDCGKSHVASANSLREGKTASCGCAKKDLWKNRIHPMTGRVSGHRGKLIGEKFGRLTVKEFVEVRDNRTYWRAECECGNTTIAPGTSLITGNTQSCGCLRDDAAKRRGDMLRGKISPWLREKTESVVGSRFGKLVVQSVEWRDLATYRVAFASCQCDCGGTVDVRVPDLNNGKTVTCGCGATVSTGEADLVEFLRSVAVVEPQFRVNGWSYDALLPEHKILIEFNGTYWHSYPRKRRGAHLVKRRNAEDHGYRMITIWEDEWKNQRPRMEELIRRAVAGPGTKIAGRNTSIVEVSAADAKAFHEEHHVQGFSISRANLHYGLVTRDGRTAAVASFDADGVLHRYTVRAGTTVHGGLSKVIAAYRRDFPAERIITYCDRDLFTGQLYRAAGFERTDMSLTMSYVERGRRVRRERYMKHKLPWVFDGVDLSLKEVDICAEHGVFACWNSGTEKYELAL